MLTDLRLEFRLLLKSPGFTLIAGLLALWRPARQASDINPIDALRSE